MYQRYTCGVYGVCADEFIAKVCVDNKNCVVVKTTAGRVEFRFLNVNIEDYNSLESADLDFIIQITNFKDYAGKITSEANLEQKMRSLCDTLGTYGYVYVLGCKEYRDNTINSELVEFNFVTSLDKGDSALNFFLGRAINDTAKIIPHRDYIAVCGKSELALRLANRDDTVYSDDLDVFDDYNITKIIVAPASDSYFGNFVLLKEKYPHVPMKILTSSGLYQSYVGNDTYVLSVPSDPSKFVF